MYPRRTLIPVPDSRAKRKAARNNKYLYSLRLKNIRSAVKKKLKNAKKRVRKPLLKKCRIADKKPSKSKSESQNGSNSLIISEVEVKNFEKESPKPVQQTEESYAGNKHTRSFSKRCNEMASIYIPCDYSYELNVRKIWPTDSCTNEVSVQELHQSDQLQYSIREVMKDSLDLVLGYCFLYVPEEIQTDNIEQQSVNGESVISSQNSKNESVTDKIDSCNENSMKHVQKTETNLFTCIKSIKLSEINDETDKYLCKNESKCCFLDSKDVRDCSVGQSEVVNNFEFPNLPEKCDDLNISEFLRPHLSPGGTKKQSIENTKLVSKSLKQSQLLMQHLTKVTGNDQAVLAVNKDHSYAKLDKEATFRESLLQNSDLNCTLFVNKESSPKQYRNTKRFYFNTDKEGTFRFGTRSKIKKVSDSKIIRPNDNMSSYCKQITKNNQNCFSKLQTSTITSQDKQTNKEVDDRLFLKELVMDTAKLYSMLCGIEPEDIAFYINSRPMDPDQWAIDILDSM